MSADLTSIEAQENAVKTVRFFALDDPFLRFVLPSRVSEDDLANLLSVDPLEIFDSAGRLLFYEFASTLHDNVELRVRAAANSLLAAPVFSVTVGEQIDMQSQIQRVIQKAVALGLTPAALPEALIAYSYPKLGLKCLMVDGSEAVLDLFEFSVSPLSPTLETFLLRAEVPTMWSLFDLSHPGSLGARQENWDKNLAVVSDSEAGPTDAEEFVIETVRCEPQQNERFCASACAKMILGAHGFAKSQEAIAIAMSIGDDGATNENQLRAYSELSSQALVARLDTTASFNEAKAECIARRPLKSGVPGHARVVAGYRVQKKGVLATSWLWVLDPWPVGTGRTYWENWDAIPHSNFIYVSRDT